jgi:RNA polymerase-binding transcription factor DksA
MNKKRTDIDLNYFKNKLQKEEESLTAELNKVSRKNPSNPDDWEAKPEDMDILTSDRNEVADKIESFEGDVALLKELEPHLNDIKLALKKIEDGNYGYCEICGERIEKERLEANSSARTCIKHINEKIH